MAGCRRDGRAGRDRRGEDPGRAAAPRPAHGCTAAWCDGRWWRAVDHGSSPRGPGPEPTILPTMSTVRGFRPGDESAIRVIMDAAFDVDRMPAWTRANIEHENSRLPADPSAVLVAEGAGGRGGYG